MEESKKPWEAKSLHEQLEDLQVSARHLENQHATLLSQIFEQEVLQQEGAWRRRHAEEMRARVPDAELLALGTAAASRRTSR